MKKLFPKNKLGKKIWIAGALIEVFGFALLFSDKFVNFVSNNSELISIPFIGLGLFIALSSRRIK